MSSSKDVDKKLILLLIMQPLGITKLYYCTPDPGQYLQSLLTQLTKDNGKIHITKKPITESWLPKNIVSKDILCLASAGGHLF